MSDVFLDTRLENPWTNVYGIARSTLAFGTFLTLIFNSSSVLFFNLNERNKMPLTRTVDIYKFDFFSLWNGDTGRILAVVVLLVVISGWKPMITGIFHTWISISFIQLGTIDGGDQVTAVLTLLLLPICLTDKRKWHWQTNQRDTSRNIYLKLFILSIFLMIRIQMAIIYLNAAVAKLSVAEWVNGTAVWYWFKDPAFGYNKWIGFIMDRLLKNSVFISLFSWLPIIVELVLFLGLFLERKYRRYLLVIGILFHFFIILFHGLASFFFAMSGGLILYLVPISTDVDLRAFSKRVFKFPQYLVRGGNRGLKI